MRKGEGYEGFCIDLLNEMAAVLKFNYTIIEVQDGTYGIEVIPRKVVQSLLIQDESGRWNGIIGVLQRHEADLSVSAVTITYSRVEVVGKRVVILEEIFRLYASLHASGNFNSNCLDQRRPREGYFTHLVIRFFTLGFTVHFPRTSFPECLAFSHSRLPFGLFYHVSSG